MTREELERDCERMASDLARVTAERDALKELADSEGTRAVECLRRARKAEAERDALKARLAAPVTEAEIRERNGGCVTLSNGVVLILAEELHALKAELERATRALNLRHWQCKHARNLLQAVIDAMGDDAFTDITKFCADYDAARGVT